MNYKLAVAQLTIEDTTLQQPLRDAACTPYYICPALLIGIKTPVSHEVESGQDAKDVALRGIAESIKERLVHRLLAAQHVCMYRTLMINVSEWHDMISSSKRVRGLNVLQQHLFSTGRLEAAKSDLDSSQIRIVDLVEWRTPSSAGKVLSLCNTM